ncbi:MAG: hypothetical protein K2X27_27310 [Candidatus Obscuribacterales bacterium]|nr:hypothetical protein [Candidatus Obscuribacterales bacterium]
MLEVAIGIAIIAMVLSDIFQAVIVPRYSPASLRFAPFLIGKVAWALCRKTAAFINSEVVLDLYLGMFAPFTMIVMLLGSLLAMIFAFALIIHGLGTEFKPVVGDFGTALYLSATSLLTIGFGDIIAVHLPGRVTVLAAGVVGITLVAIGVSFLFSMQQAVHFRETVVHTLQGRIQPANSAVSLLLNYADLGLEEDLGNQIKDWELWLASVLTSHRSYPLLCYFRSGHMCVSWITVIGIMLDTCNLLSSTVNDKRYSHAEFFLQIGKRLVRFMETYFELSPANSSVSREEFHSAYILLKGRGYPLKEEESAWEKFHLTRSEYAPALTALAFAFITQPPGWLPVQDANLTSPGSAESELYLESLPS